jgi:hypothetical protein
MSTSRVARVALLILVCGLAAASALVRVADAGPTAAKAPTSRSVGTVSTRLIINRFRAVGRKVVGRGTVISTFRNRSGMTSVTQRHVRITLREQRAMQVQEQCHILFLEIGEVDLILAGLHATLRAANPDEPIQLRLSAIRENGLLGRLFCDLTQGGGAMPTHAKAKKAARLLTKRMHRSTIMRVKATIFAPDKTGAGNATSLQSMLQDEECEVLHLVLGPVHLDLLGLVVDLNKIVLDLKAIPGTLLGDIFCQLVEPPATPARVTG